MILADTNIIIDFWDKRPRPTGALRRKKDEKKFINSCIYFEFIFN